MSPILEKVVINGGSRHRLLKGFLLVDRDGSLVDTQKSERVKNRTEERLRERSALFGFDIAMSLVHPHPAVVQLATPFLPFYTLKQRNVFILRLVAATDCLLQTSRELECRVVAAGVNPYCKEEDEKPKALCADIHQIEVNDEGELERIYNLYRQYLPELLAISTHSAVYGGTLQKDFSFRMRANTSTVLPRYISQFSGEHLEQLKSLMRQDYKLGDLRQMDINPLGDNNAEILRHRHRSLFSKDAAAIELRFIDAQCSFPFIRAQMIILQAIAMQGRTLARQGRRIRRMPDEIIDENRALALQDGGRAVLKPDKQFGEEEKKKSQSYHNKGEPEVATTALLTIIKGNLMRALRDLECEPWELYPITLGAELRQWGKRCFANYAEYQHYLCNANPPSDFMPLLQQQTEQLLSSSTFDIISDYNRWLEPELVQEIESSWLAKLAPTTQEQSQSNVGNGPTGADRRSQTKGEMSW